MEAFKLAILLGLAMAATMMNPSQAQNSPQDYVSPHNSARAAVGVGAVSWSTKLQAYAQSYANQRIGDCRLRHSGGPYGENIYWGSSTNFMAARAMNSWVGEKKDYDYGSNSCAAGKQCGHYTQIVWRASTSIGCARVVCNNNRGVFIICSYEPAGNVVGRKPY